MRERDYINITDLVRVRAALDLIRAVTPIWAGDKDDLHAARKSLAHLEQSLWKEVAKIPMNERPA